MLRPGYRAAARAHSDLRRWARAGRVLVAAQDMGLVERAALAGARAGSAAVALMPDGVMSNARHPTAGRLQRLKDAADSLLRFSGLLVGRRGLFGSSSPDVILSWGEEWNEAWQAAAPTARIVVTGSPRTDALAGIAAPQGRHLLVCSQHLGSSGGAGRAKAWYSWLERMAAEHGPEDLRIRLHPAEIAAQRSLSLGRAVCSTLSRHSLVDDLAWSSAVVSPFSTVLLEAAVVGRAVASVSPGAEPLARACAFFADDRLPSASGGDFAEVKLQEPAQLFLLIIQRFVESDDDLIAGCWVVDLILIGRRRPTPNRDSARRIAAAAAV